MTDADLMNLSIPARNDLLDEWAAESAQALSEQLAESAWLRAAEYDPIAQYETDREEGWL